MSIKKIGIADLQSGLYILKGDKEAGCNLSSRVCNSTVSQNIWHMRLGHPSRQRMAILNKRFSYISLPDTTSCDVCHLAKQRKLTFPVSTSYASFIFDLVHVDIWAHVL